MFTVVLIAIALAILAGLVTVVRSDRPLTTPRSHTHELDSHAARLHRVP